MINPRFAGGIFRLLVFAPPCANACAVFRPCGLRFAPCPRGSSRFAASGFAPCSPASPAPSPLAARGYGPAYLRAALRWPGIPGLRSASRCSSIQHGRTPALANSLAALPASLGLLRPVSRTARGLRAPLYTREAVGSATSGDVALPKRLPFHKGELSAKLTEGLSHCQR